MPALFTKAVTGGKVMATKVANSAVDVGDVTSTFVEKNWRPSASTRALDSEASPTSATAMSKPSCRDGGHKPGRCLLLRLLQRLFLWT